MGDDLLQLMKKQPHIMLLGAGASVAVMKDLGLTAPSPMKGFLKNAGLEDCLKGVTLKTKSDNLEDIYQELCVSPEHKDICQKLELGIVEYMRGFHLPKGRLSIYERIILSMTGNDRIYSFNWDPLLPEAFANVLDAYRQWLIPTPQEHLPEIHYLHGNVAVGYCAEHENLEDGFSGRKCTQCGKTYIDTELLYPNGKKVPTDCYGKTVFNWFKEDLFRSPFLTVFGYSAPDADNDYIADILSNWKGTQYGNLFFKHIEVIDIAHGNHLWRKWRPFYKDRSYFSYYKAISKSYLFNHPRTMINDWIEEKYNGNWNIPKNPLPRINKWTDALRFFRPLLQESF
ncbi:MAG: hypothetical protein J6X55_16290 [Victivallales bacterium]|nr:hypothetical protein [Victivallales bacterium]